MLEEQMALRRKHLTEKRRQLGLTAIDLAEIAELTEEKVYIVERGRCKPKHDEAVRWSKAIRMPMKQAFPEFA